MCLRSLRGRGRGREEHRHDDHRRGQHVRRAARVDVDARARIGVRVHRAVLGRRLGCRHRGDHEQAGRLRRLRCAAERRRSSPRVRGLRPDPVGARRRLSVVLQRSGCARSTSSWTGDDREDLPRPDHELERSRDRGAEPKGANLPDLKITPGLPLGRLGHVVQLHRLPVARQPDVEDRRSASRRSRRSRPASARRARAASRASSRTRRARSATSTSRTRSANHIQFAAVKNAAGKFLYPSLRRIEAAPLAFPNGAGERRDAHRRTRRSRRRSPTRSAPTRTSSSRSDAARRRAPEDDLLGADAGPEPQYAAKLRFVPLPVKAVLVAAEKTLKTIHT